MDEERISQFLLQKEYYLTALELLCESYERTGVTIDSLSNFFQDSSNFLNFDPSHSINDVSPEANQCNSEAIRIKNDKISVLEHDVKVLKDSLQEAQDKLKEVQPKIEIKSPPNSLEGDTDESEEVLLKFLVNKYLISKGYRLTSLSFQNEAGKLSQSPEIQIPNDIQLIHLLRAFLYFQNTSKMNSEVETLKKEKLESRDKISKLSIDIDVKNKQIQELEAQIQQFKDDQKIEEETKHHEEDKKEAEPTPQQIEYNNEPPSVQLLDSVFVDIRPLLTIVEPSKRDSLLNPLRTIIKNHPSRDVRIQCIQLILNLWENPNPEQRSKIVAALKDCASDPEKAESEILPIVTQMMGNQNVSILCLISKVVGEFSHILVMQLRYTLLLSIIKQFSEHSSPIVRQSAAVDGATLINSFGDNSEATDKMEDLIDLGKQFVFDPDAEVSSVALSNYIPAIIKFTTVRDCVGKSLFDYWFKLALSFGTTGSSQLAVVRFKLCTHVLENVISSILPSRPTDDQTIACEGTIENESEEDSKKHIFVTKNKFNWITKDLVNSLPKLSPILFVPIPVRKECVKLATKCCNSLGKNFTNEYILPVFLKIIDESATEPKMTNLSMFLCAIAPQCGTEVFYTNAKTFLQYAANETHELKQTDVETYFSPSFSLLSSLDPSFRPSIFKLCDELSQSHRSSVRSASMSVISEVLQTCEQKEIENDVIPIVLRLAHDPDESLQFETINVIGQIIRFTTVDAVIDSIKDLFDLWFKAKPNLRLQALRSLLSVANDVDSQFRDKYILPKLLAISKSQEEYGNFYEQAIVIIVQALGSMTDFSDDIIRDSIVPLIQQLSDIPIAQNDPIFATLKEKYLPNEEKGNLGFFKKS